MPKVASRQASPFEYKRHSVLRLSRPPTPQQSHTAQKQQGRYKDGSTRSELLYFVPHITCCGQALEESATFTGLPAVLVPMGMT